LEGNSGQAFPIASPQSLINCELFLAIFHLRASYVEVQNLQAIHQEQELHQKRHLYSVLTDRIFKRSHFELSL
jgi:hypothetical protein